MVLDRVLRVLTIVCAVRCTREPSAANADISWRGPPCAGDVDCSTGLKCLEYVLPSEWKTEGHCERPCTTYADCDKRAVCVTRTHGPRDPKSKALVRACTPLKR